jgi:hypothetical protein
MNDEFLDTIEADDLDTSGYGEDIEDFDAEDLDDFTGEDIDAFGDEDPEEDYYGEEPEDAEARYGSSYYRWRRRQALLRRRQALLRRRALQRQLALRRRRARMRSRYGYGRRYISPRRAPRYFPRTSYGAASKPQVRRGFRRVGADVQSNRANIQKVDLESKVKTDTLASTLKGQQKRISRNEYALAASKVVDEFKEQFPDLEKNKVIKTALPLAPLLFLKPQKRGTGLESVITDPRVWGPVLAAGAALYKETTGDEEVHEVAVNPPVAQVTAAKPVKLEAIARDRKGRKIDGRKFKWHSSRPNVAAVDDDGQVTRTAAARAAASAEVEIVAVETESGKRGSATVTVA